MRSALVLVVLALVGLACAQAPSPPAVPVLNQICNLEVRDHLSRSLSRSVVLARLCSLVLITRISLLALPTVPMDLQLPAWRLQLLVHWCGFVPQPTSTLCGEMDPLAQHDARAHRLCVLNRSNPSQALKQNVPDLLYNGPGCSNPNSPSSGPNYLQAVVTVPGSSVRRELPSACRLLYAHTPLAHGRSRRRASPMSPA